MGSVSIGGVAAGPGEKNFGHVKIGEWNDGSDVRMPVLIVNGSEPGPTLLITAGIHGDEVVGTEAVEVVAGDLDPRGLRGTIIGLPAINVPSYVLNTRVNILEDPMGWNDLHYLMYTAEPNGSLTARLAAFVRDQVASLCDCYIDIHSSAKGSTNYPRAIVAGEFVELSAELRQKCDRLGWACGYEYIFRPRSKSWSGMYFEPTTLIEERYGKPGIILETGHAPTTVGVEIIIQGIRNIMIELGMAGGEMQRAAKQTYIDRLVAIRANRGGLWHPAKEIPFAVKEGDYLGYIRNLSHQVVEEVRAPVSGFAIKVATSNAVSTGTRLYVVGTPYAD